MNSPISRWSPLEQLVEAAAGIGGLELWMFGSALYKQLPQDLDIAVIYSSPSKVEALMEFAIWELMTPPLDLIAFTPDEIVDLKFFSKTAAVLLFREDT